MATTTNYGWTTPDDTALVKDGAAAIRTLGSSVDTTTKNLNPSTTLGDIEYRSSTPNVNTRLPLGTANQVLRVNSGATAPEWATTADQTPLTTKGDLFGFDTADARIPIGTNGHVLTADSAQSLGLKWAAPAGGKVLQVVSVFKSDSFSSSSTSFTDVTGLSVTITPTLNTSKILVLATVNGQGSPGTNEATIRLLRDSTAISIGDTAGNRTRSSGDIFMLAEGSSTNVAIGFLDSPATTSAITYKIQGIVLAGSGNFYINRSQADGDSLTRTRSASNILVMEIGA
jgi:hypothetical protein